MQIGLQTRSTAARRAAAAAVSAALAASAAACGSADADTPSVVGRDSLVIAVNEDRPGLGFRDPDLQGFDIDVAREIARRLGVPRDRVDLRPVPRDVNREDLLVTGQVDMVVASYSITPERKTKVLFAGPYYVAHQDILVRRSDTAVRNVRDLAGRTLCSVAGSLSHRRVIDEKGVKATPRESGGYDQCLVGLQDGDVDAVSTDDLILAGLAARARDGGAPVRLVNAPFSDEPYGVGLHRDDVAGCEAVNKAITRMYQDGTVPRLLHRWFGASGLRLTTTVPQFEGCDEPVAGS
ncbi:glutamate ABC transporter substrate-binding protein [Actinomadura keratinilytica]|jgi:glutamate transport system substrate-binding protein|uniref:Glutamate ABC transporter substrate-binding protein n=1 Tax=Actinomadura keratinilytica TaxID=547461 RepID=A0ABP7YN03_9ACTN